MSNILHKEVILLEMIPVQSSNLRSVGYDSTTQTLVIEFHSGVYEYYGVPESTYRGLMSASSKGQYHHRFIKHSYKYNKIR